VTVVEEATVTVLDVELLVVVDLTVVDEEDVDGRVVDVVGLELGTVIACSWLSPSGTGKAGERILRLRFVA